MDQRTGMKKGTTLLADTHSEKKQRDLRLSWDLTGAETIT